MKTLKKHLILFDAECPMCSMYTQAFVSAGLLEKEGRTAYQDFPENVCPQLDRQRAVNEIALLNQETGEVTYGVQSLFKVIAVAIPLLRPLFNFKPFLWLMAKVYAFISYNRRVIIPANEQANSFAYQPAFKLGYRLSYLIFTWLITSFILSHYTGLMSGLLPAAPFYREYLVYGGQILFQSLIICTVDKDKYWNYLGNMMTISFAGALLLLPVLTLSHWMSLPAIFYAGWFLVVAGLMFLEHIRRSRLLKIGWTLSISWVIYRMLILLIILL
ncbi:DUF393 domain-containing protein [Pedobacter sp. HMWF019]|uniref:DUF393 domain-containing protein n=1 Tax=Pedobacter sp. HMWF019 TaxID=2056856 RepID=UPI000D37312A|nr:DUF393 domain-containing protein [Pedobacter sp. HMWF019]PTT01439.1 DUF393 domain-containing protein [Pedobacter sp. HMWF019]